MFRKIKKYFKSIIGNAGNYKKLEVLYNRAIEDAKNVKMNVSQLQSFFNNQKTSIKNLSEVEFQVFSQGGEDGILQYLISKLEIPHKTFIEFGVENYLESNTRYLFLNNNWRGLVIDGSPEHIRYIDHDIAARGELHIESTFITKDNINDLLKKPGFDREVGILSVDIDGNDYWVWEAINVITPIIVIAEYNSVFGMNTYWSVPYDPSFVRRKKHPSQLYYGVSLGALCTLSAKKGYTFIGCNSKGNNAFFIRNDKMTSFISSKTLEEGYVRSNFREARDEKGWITGGNRIKAIAGLDITDIRTGATFKIDPALPKYE
jgi:hypothetical protein